MWLIDTQTLKMQEFGGNVEDEDFPEYAILSHRWRKDEISHQDFKDESRKDSAGYRKVQQCCYFARRAGLQWAWVDTCCIDKRSSAELTEGSEASGCSFAEDRYWFHVLGWKLIWNWQAINSMFKWYARSKECYVYLDDIPWDWHKRFETARELLRSTEWICRGWTLQELIAPLRTIYIGPDWRVISRTWKEHPMSFNHWSAQDRQYDTFTRKTMIDALARVTSIPVAMFNSTKALVWQSVASKMSWMSTRRTTRIEDQAYCLLGLFGINMPLLYGEGHKAFERLQREIIERTSDETILANQPNWGGLLFAHSTVDFKRCQGMDRTFHYDRVPYVMTNKGLRFEYRMGEGVYKLYKESDEYGRPIEAIVIVLNCRADLRRDAPLCVLYLQRARCGHYIRLVKPGYELLECLSETDRINIGVRSAPPLYDRRHKSGSGPQERVSTKAVEGSTQVIYIHAGDDHHAACELKNVGVEPAVEMMQDLSE